MNPLTAAAAAGLASGTQATAAMTSFMRGAQKLGMLGKLPPRKITAAALDAVGIRRSRKEEQTAAMAAHFSFGAGAGALFSMLAGRLDSTAHATWKGAAYGALVWLVSYGGWVPALRIMPSPPKDSPQRQITMLLAHLVYGGVLGSSLARRRQRLAS